MIPAVTIEVCLVLLRQYLSGFRGYPNTEAGEKRFAEAIQSNAISIEHAEAFLQLLDENFPTVRQIHDAAFNTRAKFEQAAEEAQHKRWEKEYGRPETFKLYPPDTVAMHWQAFRDSLYYTEGPGAYELLDIGEKQRPKHQAYWNEARDYNLSNHADSIAFVRAQVESLGWPAIMKLKVSPTGPMPYRNPLAERFKRPAPVPQLAAIISQADIDRAVQERKSTAQVDKELEGWNDPDR